MVRQIQEQKRYFSAATLFCIYYTIPRNVIEKWHQCNCQIDRRFSWRAPTLKLDSVSTNGPIWSQLAPVNFSKPVLLQNI